MGLERVVVPAAEGNVLVAVAETAVAMRPSERMVLKNCIVRLSLETELAVLCEGPVQSNGGLYILFLLLISGEFDLLSIQAHAERFDV